MTLFLQFLCIDRFSAIFVAGASWSNDELIRFWGQKVKGKGHSMAKYAKIPCAEAYRAEF